MGGDWEWGLNELLKKGKQLVSSQGLKTGSRQHCEKQYYKGKTS
jgi:hypothetical protein